ncbi:MAG TPA: glycosyltransferase, partial [Candidatus Eremiobacteraceae bacterium]|nr:glycosyltransferase [Candidatus Eremiobacteraceae bacterium]
MSEPAALGIMAYNEERNIARLLDSVLQQSVSDRLASIVVVASGCTDRTCEIVEHYARRDSRISLIAEPS